MSVSIWRCKDCGWWVMSTARSHQDAVKRIKEHVREHIKSEGGDKVR